MGCDIHIHAERREDDHWAYIPMEGEPLGSRSYGVFGFLANVRNYSAIRPIAMPRGFPEDASECVRAAYASWEGDSHTPSWLTVQELTDYDYDMQIEDRRYTRQEEPGFFNGGATCEAGQGKTLPLREFLGANFFKELERLRASGAERIVFWFDN